MVLWGKGDLEGSSGLDLSTIQSVRGQLKHPFYQGEFRPEDEN